MLKLARIEEAELRLSDMERELADITTRGKLRKNELTEILKNIKEITEHLKNYSEVEIQLSMITQKLDTLKGELEHKNITLGNLARSLEEAEKAEKERKRLNEKLSLLETEHQDYAFIQEMFGKNGIQPLLMEASLPRLEELTQKFLSVICERQFSVEFNTTRETKSGKIQETLDIIVTDLETGARRDVANFSDGEKTLIRQAIRMASAVFRSEVHKNRWDTFFCDESFGRLDEINAGHLLSAMKALTDHFKKVIYISHDRELIEIASQKIIFNEKGKIQL